VTDALSFVGELCAIALVANIVAAAAAAVWLATNPAQADNGDHVLREGTRLVFEGNPPEPLAAWLAARGVEI